MGQPRKYHSKSRLGCMECKRRHRKCDESRPVCVNCSVRQLPCIYGDSSAPLQDRQSTEAPTETSSHMPTDAPPSRERLPGISNAQAPSPFTPPLQALASPDQVVNMHHMQLLSHFVRETSLMFGPSHSTATRLSLAITLSTPYLTNQVLALSALHISYLRPAQAKEYAEEAALFQANSLSSLTSTAVDVNEQNCVPMLLFSSLLGIYNLADAVVTSDGNDSNFLDKYITHLDVLRGVHAVVDGFWDFLHMTELSPFLQTAALIEQPQASQDETEQVCIRLLNLVADSDMAVTSVTACKNAIQHLRWVLGSNTRPHTSEQQQTADTIYSWPILLSADFTNLLSKRRPEALIILAHYAVVLHERREIWVVGESGSWLIRAITTYLGTFWKDWLVWPNDALARATSPGATLFLGYCAQEAPTPLTRLQ